MLLTHFTILYCTVLYCSVLYCTDIYNSVLYHTLLLLSVLHTFGWQQRMQVPSLTQWTKILTKLLHSLNFFSFTEEDRPLLNVFCLLGIYIFLCFKYQNKNTTFYCIVRYQVLYILVLCSWTSYRRKLFKLFLLKLCLIVSY